MFFIFGISNGERKLDFVQTMLCSVCGQYGRLEVFMTYMYFSLFFIPIFKWGCRYYAKSSCCQRVYELDRELGRRIQKGEEVTLTDKDLHDALGGTVNRENRCSGCGYPHSPDFDYCPKCGRKL